MICSGAMPVSLLLLIFSPPTSSHPWAYTCPGRGSPAAISIAGQMTAWKRRMSLPTRWMSAGHVAANFVAPEDGGSSPRPTAVA